MTGESKAFQRGIFKSHMDFLKERKQKRRRDKHRPGWFAWLYITRRVTWEPFSLPPLFFLKLFIGYDCNVTPVYITHTVTTIFIKSNQIFWLDWVGRETKMTQRGRIFLGRFSICFEGNNIRFMFRDREWSSLDDESENQLSPVSILNRAPSHHPILAMGKDFCLPRLEVNKKEKKKRRSRDRC